MGTKLYVGNLAYSVDKSRLEEMFAGFGAVLSAQVIMDRETNRSKGFGFVEMGSEQEAQAAIAALNGKNMDGRNLTVNEARPPEPRSGGFGGGGVPGDDPLGEHVVRVASVAAVVPAGAVPAVAVVLAAVVVTDPACGCPGGRHASPGWPHQPCRGGAE